MAVETLTSIIVVFVVRVVEGNGVVVVEDVVSVVHAVDLILILLELSAATTK